MELKLESEVIVVNQRNLGKYLKTAERLTRISREKESGHNREPYRMILPLIKEGWIEFGYHSTHLYDSYRSEEKTIDYNLGYSTAAKIMDNHLALYQNKGNGFNIIGIEDLENKTRAYERLKKICIEQAKEDLDQRQRVSWKKKYIFDMTSINLKNITDKGMLFRTWKGRIIEF
ncbi:MAG: hypothetical protein AABW79_02020 [Nanoarchaeota archaeon]